MYLDIFILNKPKEYKNKPCIVVPINDTNMHITSSANCFRKDCLEYLKTIKSDSEKCNKLLEQILKKSDETINHTKTKTKIIDDTKGPMFKFTYEYFREKQNNSSFIFIDDNDKQLFSVSNVAVNINHSKPNLNLNLIAIKSITENQTSDGDVIFLEDYENAIPYKIQNNTRISKPTIIGGSKLKYKNKTHKTHKTKKHKYKTHKTKKYLFRKKINKNK